MRALLPTGRLGDLLVLGDIDRPRPTDSEALVRIAEFSLNRADFLHLSNPATDFRPGIDAAGVVEVAARDESGPPAGTRVVLHLPGGGAAAEFVAAGADRLAMIPDGVSFTAAAAIPMGGLVARRLLAEVGPLAGHRILATGVGGGVGQFVVQLGVAAGAAVTALVPARRPWQFLAARGADIVHDVADLPDNSFDVVLESVGGVLGSVAAQKLRPRGLMLWYGQASEAPLSLDFFDLLQSGAGMTLRHFVYRDVDGAKDSTDLAYLLGLVANADLKVDVGFHGNWRAATGALEEMAHGRLRGKAVLVVD